jgi:hypothetical protein
MGVQSPPRPGADELPATALYCYGVTAATAAKAQPGAGLGGETVEAVRCGDLGALVSVPPGTVRARRRDLMTHFDVLRKAFEHGTVLPFRFGIVFDDERGLVEQFLRPRRDELAGMLRELEGQVELRVTAHYHEDALLAEAVRENPRIAQLREATRGGAAGHPAMLELGELVSAEVQARTARDTRALLERLKPLSRRYELDEEPIAYQLLRASFLVERGRIKVFDKVLEDFASANAGRADVKLVGPLPPHSFVELSHGGRR